MSVKQDLSKNFKILLINKKII